MRPPNIYKSLLNAAGFWTFIWATLQQMVVASSTYFIIEAIRSATEGDSKAALVWVLWFVISLLLVFVPNTISVIWLQRWRFDSLGLFMKEFIALNGGKTTWSHGREKAKYESWITTESGVIYENASRVIYDLYQIFLSTVLNILVIAVAIDPRISGWYVVAGVLLAGANRIFRGRIGRSAQEMQVKRRDLANVLLSSWENIFVGNRYCQQNWEVRFAESLTGAKEAAAGYDRTRTLVSSCAVSLALFVIAIGNGIFLNEHIDDPTAFAALLVTLPRQLQVIQNIFGFFGLTLSWEGLRAQLKELEGILGLGRCERDLSTFIRIEEISVSNGQEAESFQSVQGVKALLEERRNGRFTLRGRNGAGKSTLLSLLAEETGDRSFFLPSHFADLAFHSQSLVAQSDGNRLLHAFSEIEKLKDVKIILLDEWDANLDSANILKINAAIELLAQERIVLESRHRA